MLAVLKRLAFFTLITIPAAASASMMEPKFSIDPASPTIDGNITPDDVLIPDPDVFTQGRDLGLFDDFFIGEFDVLNALSYGRDPIKWPLYFSVDRVAVGLDGTDVHAEALPGVEEAHGDVFVADRPNIPMQNFQFIDEEVLGLVEGFFGDDLDALDLDQEPMPYTYFSIDQPSETNGFGGSCLASDILWSSGDGNWDNYFPLEALGFDCFDDLDALVLWDKALDTAPGPGDFALFSISTFSPSTFTFTGNPYIPGKLGHMSPSDVLWTDFNEFRLFASAKDLGLRDDDELNALDTVPEPLTAALFGTGLFGLWGTRRRRLR